MTAATRTIERSGPAIRAALATHAPHECAEFEQAFHAALRQAETDFDLAPVEALIDRWWGRAAIRANPLSAGEQTLVAQACVGNETGWIVHDQDGDRT